MFSMYNISLYFEYSAVFLSSTQLAWQLFFIYFSLWRIRYTSQISVHHVTARLTSWGCDPANTSSQWEGTDKRVKGRTFVNTYADNALHAKHQVILIGCWVTNCWTFPNPNSTLSSSVKEKLGSEQERGTYIFSKYVNFVSGLDATM